MDLEALVRALVAGDDRSIADQRVMNARIWHEIGLEFVQVDVQSTVEAEGRGNGADNLSNQAIQMLVIGSRNVEIAAADIVDSFVVDEESTVGILDGAVGGEYGIVRLDNRGGNPRSWIDGELELGLLAIVC